jgi:hypothetical protein
LSVNLNKLKRYSDLEYGPNENFMSTEAVSYLEETTARRLGYVARIERAVRVGSILSGFIPVSAVS